MLNVFVKFTRYNVKICFICAAIWKFHAELQLCHMFAFETESVCMLCVFPHVSACVRMRVCVCETQGLMASAGCDWGCLLSASIIAAQLSVYCEPFHMSTVVKQPEPEGDRGSVTTWEGCWGGGMDGSAGSQREDQISQLRLVSVTKHPLCWSVLVKAHSGQYTIFQDVVLEHHPGWIIISRDWSKCYINIADVIGIGNKVFMPETAYCSHSGECTVWPIQVYSDATFGLYQGFSGSLVALFLLYLKPWKTQI